MPKNTIKGPKTPEERIEEQEIKEKASRKEREAVADFQEEEKALENAEGCEVTQTATGKTITRHNTHRSNRSRRKRLRAAFLAGGVLGTIDQFSRELINLATATFVGVVASPASGISGQYNTQVNPRTLVQPRHEDHEYLYDTMFVSKAAHEKLMRESEILNSKLAEIQAVKDVGTRAEMAKKIEQLAEEFEMRPHPLTGIYVHDINRVMREEKLCNIHNHKAEHRVCIFLLKAEHGDLRGIKAKIADQYDQTPEEVQTSGDHLKGHAPAPAPHLV